MATWIPHFLTWPFFVDHDVFAALALEWDAGLLPYRDCFANNFPGTIYLFWFVGKAGGWGRTTPIFALDSALVILFGVAMLLWSQKRFQRVLPGSVGYASFLSYYLSLDHSLVCQRDWHGPLFMVLGLMLVDGWQNRFSRLASTVCVAVAFAIRPQVVLLLPALAYRVAQSADGENRPRCEAMRLLTGWFALTAIFIGLTFLPIFLNGLWSDFLRSIRLVAYGGNYNQVSFSRVMQQMLLQALHPEYLIIPFSLFLLSHAADSRTRATIRTWLIALLGVWFYRPLSPVPWPYLSHPIVIVLSTCVAVLVHLVLFNKHIMPSIQLCLILVSILAAGVRIKPEYCSLQRSFQAVHDLKLDRIPQEPPLGSMMRIDDVTQESYSWRDYRDILMYLRKSTSPTTRVANLLRLTPALIGPTARLSAIPAESLAWLVVKPNDEATFRRALEHADADSVVVWAPFEENQSERYRLAAAVRHLAPVVRRYYELETRFGQLEIWRRKKRCQFTTQGLSLP